MELISRVELNTMRNPKKPEALVLRTYEHGVTTLNNQPIGSTPYEAAAALRRALAKLDEHGALVATRLKDKDFENDGVCECLKRSLAEKSEEPYGCDVCMGAADAADVG